MVPRRLRRFLYPILLLSLLNFSAWGEGTEAGRDSIGEARMLEDGTIVLWLRAEGPNGQVGDGFLKYQPSDPKYAEIKRHVGDLKPGESKPVSPWKE